MFRVNEKSEDQTSCSLLLLTPFGRDTIYVCAHSVTQLCPTLCDPMDYSTPGCCLHGILQARILEWVVISFSRGSPQPKDQTCVSCFGRQVLHRWATWEAMSSSFLNTHKCDHVQGSECCTVLSGPFPPGPKQWMTPNAGRADLTAHTCLTSAGGSFPFSGGSLRTMTVFVLIQGNCSALSSSIGIGFTP